MKEFLEAIRKAYRETHAEKIQAKKYLNFIKKEYKRISEYCSDLKNIELVLYEKYYIFPDDFPRKISKPYGDFLNFIRYGASDVEVEVDDYGLKGYAHEFESLTNDIELAYKGARQAYKDNDYEYITALYEYCVSMIERFDDEHMVRLKKHMTDLNKC